MLRYAAAGIVGFVLIAAAAFLIIAWFNDRDAEAGPPPLVAVYVREGELIPSVDFVESPSDAIPLKRGKLYELRLVNQTPLLLVGSADGDGITQLPFESSGAGDGHSAVLPEPRIRMTTPAGASSVALVRFSESGEYEVTIETPGRPETVQVATFIVR